MNINPNMITQFMQFKNSFTGNPQQIVQQMLRTGQVSPERYKNAVNMVNEFQKVFRSF